MCSDIHISSDGRHLYVSDRCFGSAGSLSVLDILEDGHLQLKQVFPLAGKDPRGFNLNKENTLLFVSLLDQNLIQIFSLAEDGRIREKKENCRSVPRVRSLFNKRNSPAGTVFILLWGSAAFPFCDVVRI